MSARASRSRRMHSSAGRRNACASEKPRPSASSPRPLRRQTTATMAMSSPASLRSQHEYTGSVAVEHAQLAGAGAVFAGVRQNVFDEVGEIRTGGRLARPAHLAGRVEDRDAGRARQERADQLYIRFERAPGIRALAAASVCRSFLVHRLRVSCRAEPSQIQGREKLRELANVEPRRRLRASRRRDLQTKKPSIAGRLTGAELISVSS